MRAARTQSTMRYEDSQISLYQDLSTLTLDARRALKPLTSLMQEKRIPYRWGFPFSLQAKVDNQWHVLRWPNDIPCFLQAVGLPTIPIPNWILDCLPTRPYSPTVPAENLSDDTSGPRQRRGGQDDPEE
ncbi:Hypothetical predicted protein [Pelobates cultripes]|uniref:Uncharacterized protein n=1 Tax=Pelobates cultripes TaxID=61616 RepID=A0AAD1RXF8_PELCU|nr:Hypothetical predicted protein [Pelobates cultripes]